MIREPGEMFGYDRQMIEEGTFKTQRKVMRQKILSALFNCAIHVYLIHWLHTNIVEPVFSVIYETEKVWATLYITAQLVAESIALVSACWAYIDPRILLNGIWQQSVYKIHRTSQLCLILMYVLCLILDLMKRLVDTILVNR